MNQKVVMQLQDEKERIKNFEEVALGYSFEEAVKEASRCLECRNAPCISGCPVSIDIPAFIKKIKLQDINKAFEIITDANLLPGICGRVCPQESQCEAVCVRGKKGEAVAIGRLERFVADHSEVKKELVPITNAKIAVVGSGPAGLACAGVLGQKGYEVHIFEALHVAGGVLMYGIPEFRLPKRIVKSEIENLKNIGIKFHLNTVIGKTKTIDDLFEDDFKAVFVGSGAGLPKFMGIEGENLNGVYSANEFLTRVNLMKAYLKEYDTPIKKMKRVVVVGGGNVAMDAARCAKRLDVDEVYIVYRRGFEEMPARHEEIEHAKEEGIIFKILTNPIRVKGDEKNSVIGVECVEMELGEADSSGRRSPVEKQDSNFVIEADTLIMALGNYPNPLIASTTPELKSDRRGCLIVNEELMTSKPNVYAGGDVVTGAATVILAMGAGKKAAYEIDRFLSKDHE